MSANPASADEESSGARRIFTYLGGRAINVFHLIHAALPSHLLGVVGRGHLKRHDGVVGEKRLVLPRDSMTF